jgi:hypothetical protein
MFRWLGLGLATLLLLLAGLGRAQGRGSGAGYAVGIGEPWRFTMPERRVKVVLLAGSIGAWRDRPYARVLQEACSQVEIRNLSAVGLGAPQLYDRFRAEVLEGGTFPWGVDGLELWLMWNGGLNSAGSAPRTNRAIRRAFVAAHRRGMQVVGLTLSPWGSLGDRRFRDAGALDTLRSTRAIVDYVMGRLTPAEALGSFVSDRDTPDAPWEPRELADVRVDLYNSRLRALDAPLRDAAEMEGLLGRDRRWRTALEALPEPERATRRSSDVGLLAELPRWFLRDEYTGFDAIHPNREGHQVIAETICPSLPASWGCTCPPRAAE